MFNEAQFFERYSIHANIIIKSLKIRKNKFQCTTMKKQLAMYINEQIRGLPRQLIFFYKSGKRFILDGDKVVIGVMLTPA